MPFPLSTLSKIACRAAALPLLLMVSAACGKESLAAPLGQRFQVVRALPHDREAYTQGFLFHDGAFFESTGLYGASTVRKVAIESGEVLARRDLSATSFGEGLAVVGPRLYQLTWKEGVALVYDLATLELLGSVPYPGDGWGLTTDGTHLILSDGTYLLRFVDPESFDIVRQLEVTYEGQVVLALNELEWVRGEIWANLYQDDRIARIDPTTGQVLGWLNTRGLLNWLDRRRGADVANGIAYDSITDRVWLTGKRWPWVFEVGRPR